jgi:hypothetical protein
MSTPVRQTALHNSFEQTIGARTGVRTNTLSFAYLPPPTARVIGVVSLGSRKASAEQIPHPARIRSARFGMVSRLVVLELIRMRARSCRMQACDPPLDWTTGTRGFVGGMRVADVRSQTRIASFAQGYPLLSLKPTCTAPRLTVSGASSLPCRWWFWPLRPS